MSYTFFELLTKLIKCYVMGMKLTMTSIIIYGRISTCMAGAQTMTVRATSTKKNLIKAVLQIHGVTSLQKYGNGNVVKWKKLWFFGSAAYRLERLYRECYPNYNLVAPPLRGCTNATQSSA